MNTAQEISFIESFRTKRLALLRDDAHGNGRAVLVAPAQDITADEVNRVITLTGGLILVALSPERIDGFALPKMSRPITSPVQNAVSNLSFDCCISVDAREGITTGISAADRAQTLNILAEDPPSPRKLVRPGHVFPVRAQAGGVLVASGIPEGALDLVQLAGFRDAAVFIDLLDERGNFLPPADQNRLAAQADLPLIELSRLIRRRLETEQLVQRIAEARLPNRYGSDFRSHLYRSRLHGGEHLALVHGLINPAEPVLTRVQTEHTFADVFGGNQPATRRMIHDSLRLISSSPSGVLVYLRKSSTGELAKQLTAGANPAADQANQMAARSPSAFWREYAIGAQILRDLGVRRIKLLTNNQKSLVGLKAFGLEIVSQQPISAVSPETS